MPYIPKEGAPIESHKTVNGDCEDVLRHYIDATINVALHHRFHHHAAGTLEEICLQLWSRSVSSDMTQLLARQIEERGYMGETGTPPPGSPHEHSYYVKRRNRPT